jgi:hypothetical protein
MQRATRFTGFDNHSGTLVLLSRPRDSEGLSQEQLATRVARETMAGVALPPRIA